MSDVALTRGLQREYEALFASCVVNPAWELQIDRIARAVVADRGRYEGVAAPLGLPWMFVAVLHSLEASRDFRSHLHNGDPLAARTVKVPVGRPHADPPFTWEHSAADALRLHNFHRARDWSLAATLWRLERYNGFGYRRFHTGVLSPYLWSGSNHYQRGKYRSDGVWDRDLVSTQIGGAVMLRRLAELQQIDLSTVDDSRDAVLAPLVVGFHAQRPRDADLRTRGVALQHWLNTHPGIFLREDGWPGPATAAAYRRVTGHPLAGAPT